MGSNGGSRVAVFTTDEREQLRTQLVVAAQNDGDLCGAAHLGSMAGATTLDRWSDIDLALGLRPNAEYAAVVGKWTERMYDRHGAVAHVDVMSGATLYRVFLLGNTLQVDISFWRADDFAARGPRFRLIFGEAGEPRQGDPPDRSAIAGMAWLYALHVRSSLARGRPLQAEFMLAGMRNSTNELTCLRYGVNHFQGRGLDDLPPSARESAAANIPKSAEPRELRDAFGRTMRTLLNEIEHFDGALASRLWGPLDDIVASF